MKKEKVNESEGMQEVLDRIGNISIELHFGAWSKYYSGEMTSSEYKCILEVALKKLGKLMHFDHIHRSWSQIETGRNKGRSEAFAYYTGRLRKYPSRKAGFTTYDLVD